MNAKDWPYLLVIITAALNAVAAVLAWGAKLKWSKEFAAAKDETIRAKEAQLENLRAQLKEIKELNPATLRDYHKNIREGMEEYIETLKRDLSTAKQVTEDLRAQIETPRADTGEEAGLISHLKDERRELQERTLDLENQVRLLQSQMTRWEGTGGLSGINFRRIVESGLLTNAAVSQAALRDVFVEGSKFRIPLVASPQVDQTSFEKKPLSFERYTEKARRVVFFGRFEAGEVGSPAIEPEHLLLGLMREAKPLMQPILTSEESIRERVAASAREKGWSKKQGLSSDMLLSDASKRVLGIASIQAEKLNDKFIWPKHILLGLILETPSLASEILKEQGIATDEVLKKVPSGRSENVPTVGTSSF